MRHPLRILRKFKFGLGYAVGITSILWVVPAGLWRVWRDHRAQRRLPAPGQKIGSVTIVREFTNDRPMSRGNALGPASQRQAQWFEARWLEG
ncbi:MAG TPA: hypothetical protein VFT34_17445 [Verrucomicrobiae bacterium]|nr:hypothetical protein [Verrucomicrobiae bacterium]